MDNVPSYVRKLFDFLKACGVQGIDIAQRLGVSNTLVTMWRQGQREVTPAHHEALSNYVEEVFGTLICARKSTQTSDVRKRIVDLHYDIVFENEQGTKEAWDIITKAHQDVTRYLKRPLSTWRDEDYAVVMQSLDLIQQHLRRARTLTRVVIEAKRSSKTRTLTETHKESERHAPSHHRRHAASESNNRE